MPKSKKPRIILGIDPGIADTGFGIIEYEKNNLKPIAHGTIKTKASTPLHKRLEILHKDLSTIIKKYKPDMVGVEQLFFAKNAKTAMTVGQARGVVLLTIAQNKLPYLEFTPPQIKLGISGYGKADKKQVQEMVKSILKLKAIPRPDDAADALAVAVCCAQKNY